MVVHGIRGLLMWFVSRDTQLFHLNRLLRSSATVGTKHMRTATSAEHGVMRCPAALLRLGASPSQILEYWIQSHKGTKQAMKNNRIPIGQANSLVCSLSFFQHFLLPNFGIGF
jgi:hypothetical protein